MPKRLVDGEAMWTSSKIRNRIPSCMKAEFAWLLPMQFADGTSEWEPDLVHVKCYAFARPEITVDQVKEIMAAFERADLVRTWEVDGKRWAYWVNSDKAGRLPPRSLRKRYAGGCAPPKHVLEGPLDVPLNAPDQIGFCGVPVQTSRQYQTRLGLVLSQGESETVVFAGSVLRVTKSQHAELTAQWSTLDLLIAYRRADFAMQNSSTPVESPLAYLTTFLGEMESRQRKPARSASGPKRPMTRTKSGAIRFERPGDPGDEEIVQ